MELCYVILYYISTNCFNIWQGYIHHLLKQAYFYLVFIVYKDVQDYKVYKDCVSFRKTITTLIKF